MKARLQYKKGLWWCDLPSDEGFWVGNGKSPIVAWEDYVELASQNSLGSQETFDYDWCKDKGLIQ